MQGELPRRRVLAALGAAALAGCPSASDGPDPTPANTPDPDTGIDVFTDYAGEEWLEKWTEDVVPGWEARSDVPVRIETPPYAYQALEEAIEAGEPPELYHGEITQLAAFVGEGRTEPVDDLVEDLTAANGELVCDRSIRTGGTTHIVPHGLYLGGVLNYRADVYEDLGLSVPRTWDELVENARAIDEAAVDARGFAVSAGRSTTKSGLDFLTWLYTAGGRLWRWADESRSEVALDFQPRHVRPALEHLRRLARYSPDPTDLQISDVMIEWIRGNVAQCLFVNAWLAGEAYAAESPAALETAVAPAPIRDRGLTPVDRGWTVIDGTPIFGEAESPEPAADFLRYMYRGPDRQADKLLLDPMRFLPPYADVLGSRTYREARIFQEAEGHFLELNERCLEDIAPHHQGDRARTTAAWYAQSGTVLDELVGAVVGDGAPIDEEIERAHRRLASRLSEGRAL